MRGFSHRRGAANPPPPPKNALSPGPAPGPGSEAGAGFGRCRFPPIFQRQRPRPGPAAAALTPLGSPALPPPPEPLWAGAWRPRCLQGTGWSGAGMTLPSPLLQLGLRPAESRVPEQGGELQGRRCGGGCWWQRKPAGLCEAAVRSTEGRGGGAQRRPCCSRCPFVCVCSFCRPASAFSQSCSFLS